MKITTHEIKARFLDVLNALPDGEVETERDLDRVLRAITDAVLYGDMRCIGEFSIGATVADHLARHRALDLKETPPD